VQLSIVDIHRVMFNGPVTLVSYAHNRIMHLCDTHIPGFVLH
jgi:hypothetical protein